MTTAPEIVHQLAEFVEGLDLESVPADVIHEARRCVLDTVGVTVAGQSSSVAQGARRYANQAFAGGASQVLGLEDKLQPSAAALVNGTAAHALDFDDTSYTGIMHGSAVVLPAALAVAEQTGASGRDLLTGFIAGVEVEYAIAEFCTTHLYFKGWWTSGVYGALGAAAASARVLGLDANGIADAMALALSNASGMKSTFGYDAKPLGIGLVSSRGVDCAYLAQHGLTGPDSVFEGPGGFLSLYVDDRHGDIEDLQLGQRWRLRNPGILFKSYPVCSAAQAGAELARNLLRDHDLSAAEVERVICEVPPLVDISLVYDSPSKLREAQFSMPFAVGCMLAFGDLGLDHLNEETLQHNELNEQMNKVHKVVPDHLANDPTVLERCPEGAGVTLVMNNGTEHGDFLERPTGMPGNPVSDEALMVKFANCLNFAGRDFDRSSSLARAWLAIDSAARPGDLVEVL